MDVSTLTEIKHGRARFAYFQTTGVISDSASVQKIKDQAQPLDRKLGHVQQNNNLLLTEREGRTGEYWPEVVTTTEGQYSPVRLELARLVSSLFYGT